MSIVLLFLVVYTHYNLHTYSPYYAKQQNNDGDHREVIFLVKDLEYVNKPDSDDYYYDYDGQNTMGNNRYRIRTTYQFEKTCLLYQNYEIDKNYIYIFDKNLNLIKIINCTDEVENMTVTKEIEKRVCDQLLEDIQLVMDMQEKPIINLQCLFNYLYDGNIYWKFSDKV